MAARPIYLDYQATTPLDPRVRDVMERSFREAFGNPHSSTHAFGWESAEAVRTAREHVAELVNAGDDEIIFTSGATESCNVALRGAARAHDGRREIVTLATEHPAVLETVEALGKEGFEPRILPVGRDGILDLDTMKEAVSERTLIVSVMLVNNEIGVIQPVAEVAAVARERGALMHTDATQAMGRMTVDVEELGVDLLSMSAHKMYGPKGVGALYVRDTAFSRVAPLTTGGGQERGLRPGTLPVPLIAGFGEACAITSEETESDRERVGELTTRLWEGLLALSRPVHLHGSESRRVAGNLNVAFPGLTADEVVASMQEEVAISTGSACASVGQQPSHVLAAIYPPPPSFSAPEGIRISLGRFTTRDEVDRALEAFRNNLPPAQMQEPVERARS